MAAKGSSTGRCVMGVVGVAMAVGIILIAIPMVFGNHRYPQYQESEVKQKLHAIQLAVERYATDHEGPYPLWLSGGSYPQGDGRTPDGRYIADPLITEGYMPVYPRNPFASGGAKNRKKTIWELRALQEQLQDPLRPDDGSPLAAPAYRFGRDHDLMGNVLADPRFAELTVARDENANPITKRTNMDTIYRCWDIEELDEPQYWLQGQFFYKSFGPLIAIGNAEEAALPQEFSADGYILGAYGEHRTKGQDVLGEEQRLTMQSASGGELELRNHTGLSIPGSGRRVASPFAMEHDPQHGPAFIATNPNGIADGVVLVLSSLSLKAYKERELGLHDQSLAPIDVSD